MGSENEKWAKSLAKNLASRRADGLAMPRRTPSPQPLSREGRGAMNGELSREGRGAMNGELSREGRGAMNGELSREGRGAMNGELSCKGRGR